tara:strand:+ start:2120 stop:2803 length:684 start_codon:yes stop_codon:yes gene_type:complete
MSIVTSTTFNFLKELKLNNNRDWFQENKNKYEASHQEMAALGDELLKRLNQFDEIETISGKKSLFRIYRDVRFSKNKAPYKTNRSGSFKRAGENRRGGYYFSIEPGNSMIGGGFYAPNASDLKLIREQIEMDAEPLKQALANKKFKNYFGELLGEKLKTVPRGFNADDPNIDLLRFKNFYVMKKFSDQEVMSADFPDQIIKGYQLIQPFFEAMTLYLTTDLNGESLI